MDNASYHNVLAIKHPTSNSNKAEMLAWLDEHGIRYEEDFTKPELYHLIKMHKPVYTSYTVDAIFARHGHTVCRLPPYHPELNPIEKIWANVKNWVATKNVTFKLGDVEKLTREKFESIDKEEWSKVCRHVIDIERDYIVKEYIVDTICDEFIISVNNESSDDDFEIFDDEI